MTVELRVAPAALQAEGSAQPFHEWLTPEGEVWTSFFRTDGGYLLRFPGVADFQVAADGKVVTAQPVPGVSRSTLDHLFLNQALPLALSRQGQVVLHASAVAIGVCTSRLGAAFLANSGGGKSTLAADFAGHGSPFLTDDGLQLRWEDGACWIDPSHPSIRLWSDSRAAIGQEGAELAATVDYTDKARLLAGPALPHCNQPLRLARMYFLGDGSASSVKIEPMSPAQACIELARHVFLLDLQDQALLAWQFDELARLAALPIHFRLDYPRNFDVLPRVRAAIEAHVVSPQP